MGTIFEFNDYLENNSNHILLTHSLGEELANEIRDSGCGVVINPNGSVEFTDCPDELLERIKNKKSEKKK